MDVCEHACRLSTSLCLIRNFASEQQNLVANRDNRKFIYSFPDKIIPLMMIPSGIQSLVVLAHLAFGMETMIEL